MELPDGASLSDNDDKNPLDPKDPHRALDINLDEEEFFAAPPLKAQDHPVESKEKSYHRKKKESEPEPVLLIDDGEKKKKDKKHKHKRKKENDLLEIPEVAPSATIEKSETKVVKKAKKKSSKKDENDDGHSKRKHKKEKALYDEFEEL